MLYSYIFKTETRVFFVLFFFCKTATFAFNFFVKINVSKKNFLERASIYRCWWLYLYEIVTLDMII